MTNLCELILLNRLVSVQVGVGNGFGDSLSYLWGEILS
jgi:hypothetical protein